MKALFNSFVGSSSVAMLAQNRQLSQDQFISQVMSTVAIWQQQSWEKIGLYYDDGIDFTVALFAALYAQKHPVILADKSQNTIDNSQLIVDIFAGDIHVEIMHGNRWVAIANDAEQYLGKLPFLDANACCISVFTSGSTGQPKEIIKSLSCFIDEVNMQEQIYDGTQDDVFVSTVSHQHVYGLIFKIFWPLLTGRICIADTIKYPEQLIELSKQFSNQKINLISSPAFLSRTLPQLVQSIDRNQFSRIYSSGGPLQLSDSLAWQKQFAVDVIEIFGSSETGGIAHRVQQSLETGDVSGQEQQLWTLLPQVTGRLNKSEKDQTQELVIRSPYCVGDDWYISQDNVVWHNEQQFRFTGRADSIVKIEEKRVSLEAINDYLQQHEYVEQAYAEQVFEQRAFIAVCVVLTRKGKQYLYQNGKQQLNKLLKLTLSKAFEPVALPRRWRYEQFVSRNAQGKVLKNQIITVLTNPQKILLPNIVNINSQENIIELKLHVLPELHYFKGHFTEYAILPGVVQISWVVEFAQTYFDVLHASKDLRQIKFQQPIQPDFIVLLHLEHKKELNKVIFRYSCLINDELQQCSSGQILYE